VSGRDEVSTLEDRDVRVHYHFPVEGRDTQSVMTISSLWETVAIINEDGETLLQSRPPDWAVGLAKD